MSLAFGPLSLSDDFEAFAVFSVFFGSIGVSSGSTLPLFGRAFGAGGGAGVGLRRAYEPRGGRDGTTFFVSSFLFSAVLVSVLVSGAFAAGAVVAAGGGAGAAAGGAVTTTGGVG